VRHHALLANRGDVVNFAAGTLVYKDGPRSGQLYMINEGEVEIFKTKGEAVESVATLGPGEIVGLVSVLAGEAHDTSARVTKDVVATSIPREQIKKCLASEPPWMESIFNGFVRRIRELTTAIQTLHTINRGLRQSQITRLYTATQIASALGVFGESLAKQLDDRKVLFREELIEQLACALARPRLEIEKIFEILVGAGLVKLEIEPDRKRKIIDLSCVRRLTAFAEFVGSVKSGKIRKLVKAELSMREKRCLVAMVRYAKGQTVAHLPIAELEERLHAVTGQEFSLEALEQSERLHLVRVEGFGASAKLVFAPAELGLKLACMEGYRKLVQAGQDSSEVSDRLLNGSAY
jgi:CRP-like cAMP-binding protein